jgi:CRISPR-associated endonuclease/helicase Cas3
LPDNCNHIYAHSVEGRPESEWETLAAHLSEVADVAARHAAKFDAEAWGRAAGLLHDVGKATEEFQKRLRGNPARVDHATAGAKIAIDRYGAWGRLLSYAIAGHHAGLADWSGAAASGGPSPLSQRLAANLPVPPDWQAHCDGLAESLPSIATTSRSGLSSDPNLAREGPSLAHFTRMIFSALVDADRLATEAFYRRRGGKLRAPRGGWPALAELKARLDACMTSLAARARGSASNAGQKIVLSERARVLVNARRAAAAKPGLFSLTVPTGGGKTLASLTFALDHAVAHDLDRIIYVIPFTSIIEQTAAVFREALGPDLWGAVIEHHSAFREDEALARVEQEAGGESALQAGERLRFATETWDAPIVVTTAVQFFESLFSNRPGRCRKLHNIAKSVVVLDEAQMLPLPLLRPTVAAIEELALRYHTSVVLCTATQPAITAVGRGGKGCFQGGLESVSEIVEEPEGLYYSLRRVTVAPIRTVTPDKLSAALCKHPKVLCIVGTRTQARELYGLMRQRDAASPTFHLSALMCGAHRSRRLAEIKAALSDGGCRVVATTVIEAGVDIDFPVVWRQMAGLDSIAQAAGRCNREGRLDASEAVVQPFEVEGWSGLRALRANEAAARETLRHLGSGQDPLGPEAIGTYFDRLYAAMMHGHDDGLDSKGIMRLLNEQAFEGAFPFAEIASKYRMIDSIMEPVIVPWDADARTAIADLADPTLPPEDIRPVARRLQPYIVNVPKTAFRSLKLAGRIEPINPRRFDEQFIRLTDEAVSALYSDDLGLDWSDPTFRAAEDNLF